MCLHGHKTISPPVFHFLASQFILLYPSLIHLVFSYLPFIQPSINQPPLLPPASIYHYRLCTASALLPAFSTPPIISVKKGPNTKGHCQYSPEMLPVPLSYSSTLCPFCMNQRLKFLVFPSLCNVIQINTTSAERFSFRTGVSEYNKCAVIPVNSIRLLYNKCCQFHWEIFTMVTHQRSVLTY